MVGCPDNNFTLSPLKYKVANNLFNPPEEGLHSCYGQQLSRNLYKKKSVDKNKIEYRKKVADLAKQVLSDQLGFFDFLSEIGGEDWPYETGDEEVDELIDLLEHSSPFESREYYLKIWDIIEKLEKSSPF